MLRIYRTFKHVLLLKAMGEIIQVLYYNKLVLSIQEIHADIALFNSLVHDLLFERIVVVLFLINACIGAY